MNRIFLAFQFLTIIPVKDLGELPDSEVGKATAVFPWVGLAEGILLAFSATIFLGLFQSELANALLVLIITVMNGGLHLDGLSDTIDAVASRSGVEKKLLIMKDSTVGPMGVIAIVMTLLLKYVLLNALYFHSNGPVYFVILITVPLLSRWAMVPAACYSRPARQDGLGRIFSEQTGKKELLTATAATVLFVLMLCIATGQFSLIMFYLMFAMPLLFGFSFGAVWFFKKQFGGMTGDSFGAVNEIAVLLFLLIAVINKVSLD